MATRKRLHEWCASIWDLFVFEDSLVDYGRETDPEFGPQTELYDWEFFRLWQRYVRERIITRYEDD